MEKIHKNRRELLISDVDQWPLSLKENAICKFKINVEQDLWNNFCEIAPTLSVIRQQGALQMCLIPECEAFNKLKETFQEIKEDVYHWIVMRQNGDNHVFPHKDPPRDCAVYIPLMPRGEDYTPLEIYYEDKKYGIPPNDSPTVYAWNPKVTHAAYQFGQPRYNIQMSIGMSYREFFEKHKHLFDV